MKARDVMTSDVVSVPPTMQLKALAALLARRGISGAPVVNDDGVVIGVISEHDLLQKQASKPMRRPALFDWPFGAERRRQPRAHAALVGEAMSSRPITVDADCAVRDAAALMLRHGVKRLPVVERGRLVGILTRADLVRAYVRRDDEILRGIRTGVLQDTMWLDPDEFDIEVNDGFVRIAGRVDRRSTATIVEKLVRLVDGVADVSSYLTWEFDDRHVKPAGEFHEPGAASLIAREQPRPLHG